jgi:hypothetical protein
MRATDSVALVFCLCFADSVDDGDKLYLREFKDAREDVEALSRSVRMRYLRAYECYSFRW